VGAREFPPVLPILAHSKTRVLDRIGTGWKRERKKEENMDYLNNCGWCGMDFEHGDCFCNDVEPETNLDADVVAPWDECCELIGVFE